MYCPCTAHVPLGGPLLYLISVCTLSCAQIVMHTMAEFDLDGDKALDMEVGWERGMTPTWEHPVGATMGASVGA